MKAAGPLPLDPFPLITYNAKDSPRLWGEQHGEAFRQKIGQLYEIRHELMLQKNPSLATSLTPLALAQWEVSRLLAPEVACELEGIAQGANLDLDAIVILNNYTDFRDIELPDEGCSALHLSRRLSPQKKVAIAGQTWDMHQSAKDFLALIEVPPQGKHPGAILFSLVGCVGMMGVNTHKLLVGVNNINTRNARAGAIWPLLVRKLLQSSSLSQMRSTLTTAPVTSGHNYLLSSPEEAEHWEITPLLSERVSRLPPHTLGEIFHTNHCLGPETRQIEMKTAINSTTQVRYRQLQEKIPQVQDFAAARELLMSHDGFPKSICSHYESTAQDPSTTCGGGLAELHADDGNPSKLVFWRACPRDSQRYGEYHFQFKEGKIVRV